MAIEDEVLVIGGGPAGMTAALAAAREGAKVRLVSHKESTLRSATGLIDVLGYSLTRSDSRAGPGSDGRREPGWDGRSESISDNRSESVSDSGAEPIVDPFEAISELPDEHPYRIVGIDGIRESLSLFDEITGAAYRGEHTDRNALVLTHGGAVKPTARYPASVVPGLASDTREMLLVGFESITDFDAPLAADHLRAANVPFDVRGVTIRFPGGFRDDARITRYATALCENERIEGSESGSRTDRERGTRRTSGMHRRHGPRVRTALAERIEPHLGGSERVGLPGILAIEHPEEVRSSLEDALGVAVFEVPTGPPSLSGMRLESMFRSALDAAGVRTTIGVPVVDYDADGGRIERVYLDRNGQRTPHRVEQVVLASGGLIGKGITSNRDGVREPLFGCHVPHPDDRYEWFRDGVFDDQPYARFGLAVDRYLRPVDASGEPEFRNLRAAGSVLGGYDFAREKSGAGVSLATGYAAGTVAGEGTTL